MPVTSIAVDIGASSGRLIAGTLENGKLDLKEIHRFENKIVKKGNYFCWELDQLYQEIITGLKLCKKEGIKPASIGIDTWAVDFVLLDERDQLLLDAVSYRDPRTDGMMEEVFSLFSKERLYLETGIQFQRFNTIYQLYSMKKQHPDILEKANAFLMIPDYLNFLLTGKKVNEYTNASTTQLVNAFTKKWDKDILDSLEIDKGIFQEIKPPGTSLGALSDKLAKELEMDMEVILPATHDTGSAVLSVPDKDDCIYISSGTWSLIGTENHFPICVTKALDYNFTNEGGMGYQYRFLKNIMGLWMIQEVKRNYDHHYSFEELVVLAKKETSFHSIVDVNDDCFLKPDDMIKEIQEFCRKTSQPVPASPGQVAKCVFDSLAESCRIAVLEIEDIFEREFRSIQVIGGGSQNELLNQMIADVTGKTVYAGPAEATAIGNLIAQFIALGELRDRSEAGPIIKRSFDDTKYIPAEKK